MTRRCRTALLTMALATAAAAGSPTAAVKLTPTSSVDDVLSALQARGADLKGFTAAVTKSETDVSSDITTVYKGHVTFQLLDTGDARMRLTLDNKQKGKGPIVKNEREYALGGGWLTDRDGTTHKEHRYQVARPGEKVNLFELGKGPFPLPIGQDKVAVRRQFDVRPVPAAAGDPPHTVHLLLTPKAGTSFAKQFQTVDFWVDTNQGLPVKVRTLDAGGTLDQSNELTDLKVNPSVTDAEFALKPLPANANPPWTTEDKPMGQ